MPNKNETSGKPATGSDVDTAEAGFDATAVITQIQSKVCGSHAAGKPKDQSNLVESQ